MKKFRNTVYLILLLAVSFMLANCAKANDPIAPVDNDDILFVENFFETDVYARDLAVHDSVAYVIQGENGLAMFDVVADSVITETPDDIIYASSIVIVKETKRLYIYDSIGGPARIRCYGVDDPRLPVIQPPIIGQTQGISVMEIFNFNDEEDLIVYSRNNEDSTNVRIVRWNGEQLSAPVIEIESVFARGIVGLCLIDTMLFVTNGQYGIRVVDTNSGEVVTDFDVPGSAMAVKVVDNYAIVACKEEGIIVFDIAEITNPIEVYAHNTSGYAQDISIKDGLMAVASGGGGVYVYDVSTMGSPVYLGKIDDSEIGYTYSVEIYDGKIYTSSKRGVAKIVLNLE